jgi:L-ascorbate metabolism protein UlaG (beta-lactamase superfamily)
VGKSKHRGEKSMAHFHGMTLQWLGHATFHLETVKGTSILIDPWMESNPSFPKDWKAPEKIDLALCSHGHSDHIGDALSVDQRYHPTFVGIYELTGWLTSKGVKKTVGMNLGGSFQFQDVTISLVEAKHSSSIDDHGTPVYAGVAVGYILQVEGEPTLYHSGDTSLFRDMELLQELYAPVIACLPIGDHFTMGPQAAALAAQYVGAKKVIPMHYGTFPVLTGTPEELRNHLRGKEIEVIALRPGEVCK